MADMTYLSHKGDNNLLYPYTKISTHITTIQLRIVIDSQSLTNDTLSRVYLQYITPEIPDADMELHYYSIVKKYSMSDVIINVYREATASDSTLQIFEHITRE